MATGIAGTALSPADGGQYVQTQRLEVVALLRSGEADVFAPPAAGPVVVVSVIELRGVLPVPPGKFLGVLDPHQLLLRATYVEQAPQ